MTDASFQDRADALNAVDAIDWDGGQCQMYRGPTADQPQTTRCDGDVQFLLVLDSPLEDTPLNVQVCGFCKSSYAHVDVRESGGRR